MTISKRAQHASDEMASRIQWEIMVDTYSATNPNGYLNVGVAENALMHPELQQYLNQKLDLPVEYLTYNDGGHGSTKLRRSIAHFLNRHLKPATPLDAEHMVVTNGCSSAIEHVSWLFTDPGEGILLGRPFYGTFIPDMSSRPGAAVVTVEFDDVDPFSEEAVSNYEEALLAFQKSSGKPVRALMLCHPHNPLGRCYPRQVLIELMRLCQKYRIHLVSDEIYALSVFANTVDESPAPVDFESVLAIDRDGIIDPSLVHGLWGMSKDFGANGIRLGVIISQSNPEALGAIKATSLYSYASGITDHLVGNMLMDDAFTDEYVKENRKRLAESYAYAATFFKDNKIEYAPGVNAAFFLWVNLGRRYRELHADFSAEEVVNQKVMQNLLRERVFLSDGTLFGSEKDGWFRLVFTQPREYLDLALKKILKALE
ncbi:1-aminocyclopropane-1-carboxylate synthase-like protein [Penicillium ucsense]|uniref:1-aminocyclopropane-1-carboxylate synthase-like protein n=1 Tax=Penicillium ucsense TaxID=2839758 RepID=A0A8J8VYF5_9EURO|nr:1-aminocyclopropane-1-carboxylate synthase-like protein [Penicillium ucsense]KAF7731105.1 1-aminocyclopropane-1-carboxylate synthase-like protein [Penicillium ucsense]